MNEHMHYIVEQTKRVPGRRGQGRLLVTGFLGCDDCVYSLPVRIHSLLTTLLALTSADRFDYNVIDYKLAINCGLVACFNLHGDGHRSEYG